MALLPNTPAPPTWDEILAAAAPNATAAMREDVRKRLKYTTPSDEAVLGARDFLEDHDYDFDALRAFAYPEHGNTSQHTTQIRRPVRLLFHRVAAAAMLLTALAYGGWRFHREQRHQQMTQTIFYEPGLPVFAGLGGDRVFHEMMTSFRLQESAEGLLYIDTLEHLHGNNDTLSYFAGWLHYFDRDYANAARRFDEVTLHTSSIYREKSEFMSAATLCLDGSKALARTRLEGILKRPDNDYQEEAEGLLRNEVWW